MTSVKLDPTALIADKISLTGKRSCVKKNLQLKSSAHDRKTPNIEKKRL
jgi:hypothetical protein